MFDLASIVHKQTKEYENEHIEELLVSLRQHAINSIEKAKRIGNYNITISTRHDTFIEQQALRLLRRELKEKGYKVSIKYDVNGWQPCHYNMTIKW